MGRQNALHKLGIAALYNFQDEAIGILVMGCDLLVLMPTSAGKSPVFTLFALLTEQLVVVIEPHLALEFDQVRQLRQKGISAACLNSLQSAEERRQTLELVQSSTLHLLYLTPEMLQKHNV